MKKQMMKMSLVAAMVMGSMSGAHAASQATIDFTGKIVKTACDLSIPNAGDRSVNLGVYAAAEFTNTTDVHTTRTSPIMLDIGSCVGAAIPDGDALKLTAEQTNTSVPPNLKAENLWGDQDLGAGIDLRVAPYSGSGTLPVPSTVFSPGSSLDLFTASNGNGADPTNLAGLPKEVVIAAGLRAHAAPTAIKTGDLKSTIVFTAAYE